MAIDNKRIIKSNITIVMIVILIFPFFCSLSSIFLIFIKFTIQIINVTTISISWITLTAIVAFESGNDDSTQYSVWNETSDSVVAAHLVISSALDTTNESNVATNVDKLNFILLRVVSMNIIYQNKPFHMDIYSVYSLQNSTCDMVHLSKNPRIYIVHNDHT